MGFVSRERLYLHDKTRLSILRNSISHVGLAAWEMGFVTFFGGVQGENVGDGQWVSPRKPIWLKNGFLDKVFFTFLGKNR